MTSTQLLFSENHEKELSLLLTDYSPEQVFILCDNITFSLCLPSIIGFACLKNAKVLTIPAGDGNKNVENLCSVWQFLSQNGGTRKSVLINLGGGMVTDLGGFAASTFKRGIDCIHIPTTVLAAVDAAVGGKTGINFNGLKNEIGAFHLPKAVLFSSAFYKSLDINNILSGFAEMLKHGLLSDVSYLGELFDLDLNNPGSQTFSFAVRRSVEIKEDIVSKDPKEQGIRKALNLGHTVGHAFESLSHNRNNPVLHGYAVAWGIVCELYLSNKKLGFPKQTFEQVINFVGDKYGFFEISSQDFPYLIEVMTHDKKNESSTINFTLLSDIGKISLNQTADMSLIEEMLSFFIKLRE